MSCICLSIPIPFLKFTNFKFIRTVHTLVFINVMSMYDVCITCLCILFTYNFYYVSVYAYIVLEKKFPNVEYQKQSIDNTRQDTNTVSTLHCIRAMKLHFVDDSILFNKSSAYHSRISSLVICPFQHVKHIKPSEAEKEFHYITGHVVELLSCCDPKLLIKWCENLMASEKNKIKLLTSFSLYKFKKLRTSSAILKMMSVFWSWSNHSILKCLAEFSELAVSLLNEFDSRLHLHSSIAKYPISPPISSMIPYNNNSYTILTLKCNEKLQLSLQLVYDMQSVMIEKCEITEHALQLLAVQSSPLILQWMIPKHIITVINVNVRQHHHYFATKGITEILIYPYIKYCFDGNVKEFIKTREVISLTMSLCQYEYILFCLLSLSVLYAQTASSKVV